MTTYRVLGTSCAVLKVYGSQKIVTYVLQGLPGLVIGN